MAAHAIAGTNRRLVEYSFREFTCMPIDKWADASGPDTYIGRDVDRFPGGVHQKFTTTCRACHSGMDSLRGAFARYTFSGLTYKISQASWNPENLDQSSVQILRDPGWSLKWIGSLLICFGIFMLFYLRPVPKHVTAAVQAQKRPSK